MKNLLSRLYGRVADTRNVLFDFGIFRSYKVNVPVVSVGNISVGGTGKTPLTILIASLLEEMGERPSVVSRGYRREDEKSLVVVSDGEKVIEDVSVTGDEPLEMALALKGKASVVCDSDRVRGATYAIERLGATAIVLDDGFQHRRIRRELDIVVIDASDPSALGKTFPAGRLRERPHNLSRAGAIIVTRSDQTPDLDALIEELGGLTRGIPVFSSYSRTAAITPLGGSASAAGSYFVFCALGNPGNLIRQLEKEGRNVAGSAFFPDHHEYTSDDIGSINDQAADAGADALLTTRKDAVKLRQEDLPLPCFVIQSEVLIDDEAGLKELLKGAVADAANHREGS